MKNLKYLLTGSNKCPDTKVAFIYRFDWKMPPSKSSLPGKEKTVLIVRHFGASPVIRIPRRQQGGSAGVYDNTLRKPTTLPTKVAV